MMFKQNITKSAVAALAAVALVSCSDFDFDKAYSDRNIEYAKTFGDAFGQIDPNHTWNDLRAYDAEVSVNLYFDEAYKVAIFLGNPNEKNPGLIALKEDVQDGDVVTFKLDAPQRAQTFYAAVFNQRGQRVVQMLTLDANGKLVASFGGKDNGTRAVESDYVGSYAKTLEDYLNPDASLTKDEWGNGLTTVDLPLTADGNVDLSGYTSITDEMIVNQTSNGNHTLTDPSWTAGLNGAFVGHGDGHHFLVEKGTVINEVFHVNGVWGKLNDVVVYIEGEVHLKGNTLNGPTLVVAPEGKIVIDGETNMSGTGRFVVMPGGTIEGVDGVVYNVNNGGVCYNAGTIEFKGELNVNGSNVYNTGTIEVDVLRNTAGGKFTNFGHIKARTNIGAGDSYNSTIINACYMEYTENAGVGTLILLDNSRLEVGGVAEFNGGDQHLYANSILNVGGLYVNTTSFFGPENTSDFAVIKTKKIIWAGPILINQDKENWANIQWENSYDWVYVPQPIKEARGTIYLDWDIKELYSKDGDYNKSKYGDMEWRVIALSDYNYVSEATAPFSIPASECTGVGYNDSEKKPNPNPNPDPEPDPEPDPTDPEESGVEYIIAFEDLGGSDDFDFNDIVISVKHVAGEDEATVKLLAAGGTLEAYILFDGTEISNWQGGASNTNEVHGLFGVPVTTMVNTYAEYQSREGATKTSNITAKIDFPKNATIAENAKRFGIRVVKPDGTETDVNFPDPEGSEAPQAVLVAEPTWKWPTERTRIDVAYPNFKYWVSDRAANWYDSSWSPSQTDSNVDNDNVVDFDF